MGLDQQGYFWFSNPLLAAAAVVAVVGLIVWCHVRVGDDECERREAASARAALPESPLRPASTSHGTSSTSAWAGERERRDARRRRIA